MLLKELFLEKINFDSLKNQFRKTKNLGWLRLEALGSWPSAQKDHPTLTILAFLNPADGIKEKQIGKFVFIVAEGGYRKKLKDSEEALVASSASVDSTYRRKGIATAAYAFVKELGNEIVASVDQSDDAAEMWKTFNKRNTTTF